MKQISEVEEKPFTSSLNICPELLVGEGGGVTPPPYLITTLIRWIFRSKDDVTVILLLGAQSSFSFTLFSN
jgi:hypothetical protein